MANIVYPTFLEKLWNGQVNIGSDTFRASLVTSGYTVNPAHEFFSSVTNVIGTATLTGVTGTAGMFDANDTLVSSISAGIINGVVLYKWTGTSSTSPLFLFIDQGIGFNQDPSGDENIVWSNDATSKIFPLGGRS